MATTTTKATTSKYDAGRHAITTDRPRLFGSRDDMRALAQKRPEAYRRMVDYARRDLEEEGYELQAKMIGLAYAYVLEGNKKEGRQVVDLALKHFVDQPIKSGHVTFGYDMMKCAIAYDLCHDLWTPEERERFRKYAHATIDANVESETSPFHNGWYGYKHWGYGFAGYALMHDDPEAGTILKNLERDYLEIAVPALQLAGKGGGWGEGYYIHYWLMEWMFFCEVARKVEGLDYYTPAPDFFENRAVAGMFETYPAIQQPTPAPVIGNTPKVVATGISRRLIPMGDAMGMFVKHERDKTVNTRRILVGLHPNDPTHQAVHTFNETTPTCAIPCDACLDFFFRDATVKKGNLDGFKLSHVSSGPGFVYARSSWKDDATYLFFRSGPRFTAHQHMDNGNILVFKHEELLGDGGHYDSWTDAHVVSYYVRTIAHNSILIHDPSEKWEAVRGKPAANDGGQFFPYFPDRGMHQNGGASSVPTWMKNRDVLDNGRVTAYQERGSYLYTAGDYTKSYSAKKAKCVTRQIVFLRPGTIVVFDRVESTDPTFKKTVVFQPMKVPEKRGAHWVVTNGNGRLFMQALLPTDAAVKLYHGETLYSYGGGNYPPAVETNRPPICRMEVSPTAPSKFDCFVHVLTATDATVESVPAANCSREGGEVVVKVGETVIRFAVDQMKGSIRIGGKEEALVDGGV